MKATTEHIASVLKRSRLAAGLTQTELAKLVGTDQSAISAYESGSKRPGATTVHSILSTVRPRPSITLQRRRSDVLAALERHSATHPRVFGSVANGADTWRSDIDLLVTLRHGSSQSVLSELFGLVEDLEQIFGGGRVDLYEDRSVSPDSEIIATAVAI
jgi:predicted nucleotidyltransferase